MRKTRPKARESLKTTEIQLRLRPAQKAVLARAAELRQTTLGSFVLEHAYAAAQEVLAEQVQIAMPKAEWDAFCQALDAPPRSLASLRKLLSEASVCDAQISVASPR